MFVRGSNPIWSFVDLIGQQLDDSYYISFLSNTFPYLPQLVTHDNQGLVPWGQPIEFLANGTLPPDIYGDPALVYRLEIRQGPLQSDPLIYLVNDYIFGDNINNTGSNDESQDNQISNPQFSIVNFLNGPSNPEAPNPQVVFTAAGSYEIAPGWRLDLVGSGSCTVTQFITTGSENLPNSPVPPYYLEFTTTGWTSVNLVQRLNGNGAIWYNNFVAANILVKSNDSISHLISVSYVPNTPGAPVEIISAVQMSVGAFEVIQGVAALFPPTNPNSTNTTLNNTAYVDIQILLPSAGTVDISNIQLFGIENNNITTIPITGVQPDETIERQMDHLSHYYQPKLAAKRIPSFLVGWDFPLNPAQLGSTVAASAIGANKSQYVWDQTIIFQSANSGVSVARNSDGSGSLSLTAAATGQIAIIQYVDQITARKILNFKMSVNLSLSTSITNGINGTISLYYTKDGSLPNVIAGTNNSLVATLDANGKPATFNGNWFEVPRNTVQTPASAPNITHGQDAYFLAPNLSDVSFSDVSFNGWSMNGSSDSLSATFFAIVIGFKQMTSPQQLAINSISLNSGDIATRPSPQTRDEVLRECQFFYEKSYVPGTLPGAVTNTGAKFSSGTTFVSENSNQTQSFTNEFEINYAQVKRVAPSVTIYSTDGTVNTVRSALRNGLTVLDSHNVAIGFWNATNSTRNIILDPNQSTLINTTGSAVVSAFTEQLLHYVAEARLGIA